MVFKASRKFLVSDSKNKMLKFGNKDSRSISQRLIRREISNYRSLVFDKNPNFTFNLTIDRPSNWTYCGDKRDDKQTRILESLLNGVCNVHYSHYKNFNRFIGQGGKEFG